MLKAVLDTQVLLRGAASATPSVTARIYAAWDAGRFNLLLSEPIAWRRTSVLSEPPKQPSETSASLKVPRSRDDHEHLAQGAGRHRVGGRVDAQLLAIEHVEEVVGVEVVGGVHGIRRPPEHGLLQVEDAVPLGRFGDPSTTGRRPSSIDRALRFAPRNPLILYHAGMMARAYSIRSSRPAKAGRSAVTTSHTMS